MDGVRLIQGDCRDVLATLESESVDALCCDPPSGIAFMNAEWDKDKGGRDQWIAWLAEIMREALRVVKPGGHALVWALPRTSHWTAMALEDAGWEIRDSLHHLFSTGMPKSMAIDKAIDRLLGAERQVVGTAPQNGAKFKIAAEAIDNGGFNDPDRTSYPLTAPGTPEAAEWEGWGTNVAPAHEVWWLCRKPLAEDTIAAQVLATGTGAIHIDACRIGTRNQTVVRGGNKDRSAYGKFAHDSEVKEFHYETGRWPTNAVFSHNGACTPRSVVKVRSSNPIERSKGETHLTGATYSGGRAYTQDYTSPGYADADEQESVVEYECVDGCAVKALNGQGGISSTPDHVKRGGLRSNVNGLTGLTKEMDVPCYGDSGTVSRYFPTFHPFRYQPKPSRAEREMGCDSLPFKSAGEVTGGREEGSTGLGNGRAGAGRTSGLRNHHPTLKGIELMAWLTRLIVPPNGVVLDCFMGSGTTGIACVKEGFGFVGVERDPEFFAIAQARIGYVQGAGLEELPLFREIVAAEQASLFEAISEVAK